jgi:mRNA interferase MazF
MNRGEVWWLEHPETGMHPACILTRQAAIPVLHTLLVAPATRTVRRIRTEVALGPEDGMPEECALTLDNVSAVPKALLANRPRSGVGCCGSCRRGPRRRPAS